MESSMLLISCLFLIIGVTVHKDAADHSLLIVSRELSIFNKQE